MTTARQRLAQLEASLSPQALVVRWVEEVQAYPSLVDYTRSVLDLPDGDQPLDRLGRAAREGAQARAKGRSADEVKRAARHAESDVAFLFSLVIELNQAAMDRASVDRVWGHLLNMWLNALVAGAFGDDEPTENPSERELSSWTSWYRSLAALEAGIRINGEARRSLEAKYLGGHDSLFADAEDEWTSLKVQFERLGDLRDLGREAFASHGWTPDDDLGFDVEALTESRARFLADNARVKAFELLDQRERAARVMERRLRGAA